MKDIFEALLCFKVFAVVDRLEFSVNDCPLLQTRTVDCFAAEIARDAMSLLFGTARFIALRFCLPTQTNTYYLIYV